MNELMELLERTKDLSLTLRIENVDEGGLWSRLDKIYEDSRSNLKELWKYYDHTTA